MTDPTDPPARAARAPRGEVLARMHTTTADLIVDLEQTARASGFDAEGQMIGPLETAAAPDVAADIRLRVLLETYQGDYHTDSFDFARVAGRICAGDESIWFWGGADEIDRVRAALRDGRLDGPLPEVGTVSVLSAEEEFGPGHGELCRSASLDRTIGGKGFMVWRTLQYVSGREPTLSNRYHTLVLAARNRASAPGVRGGEALHRLHTAYVRSLFWGVVPYYVMQGGVLEQTELRESNRNPDVVAAALDVPWCFAEERDAAFARALSMVNLGRSPVTNVSSAASSGVAPMMRLLQPPSEDLVGNNHITLVADDRGERPADLVARCEALEPCCIAVKVSLEDAPHVALQRWLNEQGFRMSAVVPPKLVPSTGSVDRHTASAIWTKPRADLAVEPPHYLDHPDPTPPERIVLDHLRSLSDP